MIPVLPDGGGEVEVRRILLPAVARGLGHLDEEVRRLGRDEEVHLLVRREARGRLLAVRLGRRHDHELAVTERRSDRAHQVDARRLDRRERRRVGEDVRSVDADHDLAARHGGVRSA